MAPIELHSLGPHESRLRMQTIVRLRWFGVVGQLGTVLFVHWGLGYDLPLGWCLLLIALSAWMNVGLRVLYPARHRLSPTFATAVLACDIIGLAALLYLTGGLENPFALLFIAPVTVSAATLPVRSTIGLGVLAVAAATLLVAFHLPLPWYPPAVFALPWIYKAGVWTAIVAGMLFLALYTARLSREARLMTAALAASDLVLAREQRLHALDGLAAAAAHELGTPLATIALVTKELEREAANTPDMAPHIVEDIALLRSQAERCREILRKLTRSSGEQDPHHVSLPLTQLIQEAAQPYKSPAIRIEITARPAAGRNGADAPDQREPIGERRPGVIFGLGNIIENAVDFARERVEVSAVWDDAEVSIEIADDGPGFSPEIMDTLGDPYVTTRPAELRAGPEPETGRVGAGLGLGFFIAKTLLERSGAQVTVANRPAPATGAVVRITWPRRAFDLPAQASGGAAPEAVASI
ncbi:MAG: ActS/PrrB/RegB family redox-sensitive histidine kinase [Hyphomicrobiaceae bacterium]